MPRASDTKKYASAGGVAWNPLHDTLTYLLGANGGSGFGSSTTAEEVVKNWDGQGKVAIVTGASCGLGAEAARVLASRGAEVVMAVRDEARAAKVAEGVRGRHPGAKLTVMRLDLASLASVRQFAAAFLATGKQLHVLMCNAGVMACPFALSADGHELQFATNHLGHFLLTRLLLTRLAETGAAAGCNSRTVVLSSLAHFAPYPGGIRGSIAEVDSPAGYSAWPAYGQSKLANVLFTRELNQRIKASGQPVTAVCCHPGSIATDLLRHAPRWWSGLVSILPGLKNVAQGAATQVYLAVADSVAGGEYYSDCNVAPSTALAHDADLGRRLWEMSETMCDVDGSTEE